MKNDMTKRIVSAVADQPERPACEGAKPRSGQSGRSQNVSRGSLSAEEVEHYTDALTRHHGEPVRPVSEYCAAFEAWGQALASRRSRIEAMPDADPMKQHELDDPLTVLAGQVFAIGLAIRKSNLLSRLIYSGQPLRTEMCPIHKGRWSGYGHAAFGHEHICECQEGCYDITGWLPAHDRPLVEKIALFAKAKGWSPASWATHYPASPEYDPEAPHVVTAGVYTTRGATMSEAAEALARQLEDIEGFER